MRRQGTMIVMKSVIASALLWSCALVWGCATTTEPETLPYTSALAGEDDFAAGTGRAPTARTLYRLGKLLIAQQRPAEAETVLRSALERYPRYMPVYTALADLYVRHHRLQLATEVLADGLDINPDDPVLLNDLGMCHLLMDNVPEALEQFTRAAAHAGDDARIHSNRALAMGLLGRYDEALHEYERACDPATAHYNLGVICEARGDHERAQQEFARARILGAADRKPPYNPVD